MDPSNNLRPSWFAAARAGNEEKLEEILKVQPDAILYINEQGSSALHLSVENGHFNVVKMLVDFNSNLCTLQDRQGSTPLHLAASKGRVPILELILSRNHGSLLLRTKQKESILHSCVKSNNLDALQFIVKQIPNPDAIINCRDSAGDTILHLAAAKRDFEMVKYLVENTCTNVNAVNGRSSMALDIVMRPTRHITRAIKIYNTLAAAGAKRSNDDDGHQRIQYVHIRLAVVGFLFQVSYSGMLSPPGSVYQASPLANKAIMRNIIAVRVFKIFNDLAIHSCIALFSMLISLISTNWHPVFISLLSSAIDILMRSCLAFAAIACVSASWANSIPGKINQAMLVVACGMLGSVFIGLPLMHTRIMKCISFNPEQTAQQAESSDFDF